MSLLESLGAAEYHAPRYTTKLSDHHLSNMINMRITNVVVTSQRE